MSSSADPEGRPTVIEYVKQKVKERVIRSAGLISRLKV